MPCWRCLLLIVCGVGWLDAEFCFGWCMLLCLRVGWFCVGFVVLVVFGCCFARGLVLWLIAGCRLLGGDFGCWLGCGIVALSFLVTL